MQIARETLHRMVVCSLLWIWASLVLYANQNVGYMGDTIPVIVYVGVLLYSQFIPKRIVQLALLLVVVLLLVKWEYYPSAAWYAPQVFLAEIGQDLITAVAGVAHGDLPAVSDGVRTLAFFGVITFGTKLLEEVATRPIVLVGVLGLGEYVLLDLSYANQVNDYPEIIGVLLVGLCLLAMAHLPRVQALSDRIHWREFAKHLAIPGGLAVVMVLSGLTIPAAPVNWPKWSVLFTRLAASARAASPSQEPYGANDGSLGGNFIGSDAVYLRVFSDAPSYYRGTSLSTYTGKGWTTSSVTPGLSLKAGARIPESAIATMGPARSIPVLPQTERVEVVKMQYPVLFGGYQITSVVPPAGNPMYTVDTSTDTVSAGVIGPGASYTVQSSIPDPSIQQLSKVDDGNLANAFPQDLQLPASLPARDIALARSITKGVVGTYAKIDAIRQYLQSHERYQTTGVPTVPATADFVDQFLFSTHVGYCDHFSTAEAVLARAVGIPTRWVKGFVAVPSDPSWHGAGNEYVLRGTDAHSWVEVWFAGYGWVPFEPTPSFVLPLAHPKPVVHPAVSAVKQPNKVATPVTRHPVVPVHASHGVISRMIVWLGSIVAGLGVLGILVSLLIARRRALRRSPVLGQKVDALLIQCVRLVGARRADQTLREYASTRAQPHTRSVLMQFIVWYERIRYGDDAEPGRLAEGTALIRELARLMRRRIPGVKKVDKSDSGTGMTVSS